MHNKAGNVHPSIHPDIGPEILHQHEVGYDAHGPGEQRHEKAVDPQDEIPTDRLVNLVIGAGSGGCDAVRSAPNSFFVLLHLGY